MNRKTPLVDGQTIRPGCAPCLLRRAVDEHTSEHLTAQLLARRVGWAIDLATGMAADLAAAHWNSTDIDLLAAGEDTDGRTLPSSAWMALRRLNWTVAAAPG